MMKHLWKGQWRRAAAYVLIAGIVPAVSGLPGAHAEETDGQDARTGQAGQGGYSPAIVLLGRNLEARERTLGTGHPLTLTTMSSLASLYKAQARYSEAEPLYKRALEASERTLGKEHPVTLTAVSGLASLYKAQGRYQEAKLPNMRAVTGQEPAARNQP